MSSIIYPKSNTLKGEVNTDKLKQEIESSNISKVVESVVEAGDEFAIVFSQNLTTEETNTLTNLVTSHNFFTVEEEVKLKVSEAIKFGQELIINFASENVIMGITQANKTKDVADFLSNLMRYAQSGSLYEVINEIDRLKFEGLPVDLEPFITESRLDTFKQSIIDFLS